MTKSYKKSNGIFGKMILISPIGRYRVSSGEQWQYLRLINQLTRTPLIGILAETSEGQKNNYQFVDNNQIMVTLSDHDVELYAFAMAIANPQLQYSMSDFYINIQLINQQNQVTYNVKTTISEGGSIYIPFDRN